MEPKNERSRIRDNQRKSRARKKEYLLEIEQRLRDCQSQEVKASVEMQQAARLVANENHKLRQLLYTMGLDDRQIEQYIETGNLNSSIHIPPYDVHESSTAITGQKAAVLEGLLVPRWPECLQSSMPLVTESRQGSIDRTLTYDPASNSSAGNDVPSAEDVQQSYGPLSASPTNLNSAPIYPPPEHLQTQEYRGHQLSREDFQYAESDHSQTSHGLSLNPHRHDPNQTFHYQSVFSAENPLMGQPLPTCCVPPATPYLVYHPSYQQPISYVANYLGSNASNNSGPASVADADSSIGDQASQQVGNSDNNA